MEKKIIQFKGMSNVPDDQVSQDGQMAVLMNARIKNGEIVQRMMPELEKMTYVVKKAIYHAPSDRLLELDVNGVLRMNGEPFYEENVVVVNFETTGNLVVVYLEKDVVYSIWRDDKYNYLGALPALPKWGVFDFDSSKHSRQETMTCSVNPDAGNYYWRLQKGLMDKALSYIYSEKGYVDRAWFRIGVRLFDGTYICLSDTMELSSFEPVSDTPSSGIVEKKILGAQVRVLVSGTNMVVKLYYFVPEFYVEKIDGPWTDLIAGIDILSTGSIMSYQHGMLNEMEMENPLAGVEVWKTRTAQQLKDALLNAEFYRVATYDTGGNLIWSIDNTSPSNIAVQNRLEDVVVHKIIPMETEVYNGRLHAYDFKEVLFGGYGSMTTYYGGGTEREDAWDVYVYIKTDAGIKIVHKKEEPVIYLSDADYKYIYKHSYVFSYPDSRAFKAVVYKSGKTKEFVLTPHPSRNEAFFIETKYVEFVEFYETLLGAQHLIYLYDIPVVNNIFGEWEDGVEPKVDDVVYEKNVLKVGEVDNAIYFPAEMTYYFDSNIVGVASMAEAVSQGQFGEFPLYVFTKMDVFAMRVDATGKTAYLGKSVVSRERCSGDICATSSGIAFTTPRGVMLLAGREATDLSVVLDGIGGECVADSFALLINGREWTVVPKEGAPIGNYIRTEDNEQLWIDNDNYEGVKLTEDLDGKTVRVSIASSGELLQAVVCVRYVYAIEKDVLIKSIFERSSITTDNFAPVPIRAYLDGAKLAYDYLENELVVSNNKYGTSYVYSFADSVWSMMNVVFDVAAKKTFDTTLYDNVRKNKLVLKGGHRGGLVAITRPLKTDSLDYKRLRQAALRTTFKGSLNFYILGSNDGANFVCITGKEYPSKNGGEPTDVMRRDLVTSMSRSRQYKYFAIAIAGNMEGRISMAELLMDAGFANNQLR